MKFSINQPIAIIDSGIGGVSVLKQLIKKFNGGDYVYFADNLYMPYGNKNKSFIKTRIDYLIKLLKSKYNARLIVIACNTASTCIDVRNYQNVYVMKFDNNSTYYATNLTKQNLKNLNIIADKELPLLIEKHIFNSNILSKIVKQRIKLNKLYRYKSIILGCTHYELISDLFKNNAPKTTFINNSEIMLEEIGYYKAKDLNVALITSKKSSSFEEKFYKLLLY